MFMTLRLVNRSDFRLRYLQRNAKKEAVEVEAYEEMQKQKTVNGH